MSSAVLFVPIVADYFFKCKINKSKTILVEVGMEIVELSATSPSLSHDIHCFLHPLRIPGVHRKQLEDKVLESPSNDK